METPSKVYLEYGYLKTKPFYRETWFVVALAAASIVIIIMVVAILCVKSKTYKYKGELLLLLTTKPNSCLTCCLNLSLVQPASITMKNTIS